MLWITYRTGRYPWRDNFISFAILLGQPFSNLVNKLIVGGLAIWAYQHSLFDLPVNRWWTWAALFLYLEFTYYWFHRWSHTVRWMWASHAVHHTPAQITLLTAVRLPLTTFVQGNWIPLSLAAWIGFNPAAIIFSVGAIVAYVFLVHTEVVPRLGPLEWFFNTPHNHRVHHSSEEAHIDRNYGNVLMIFDHLFGSYIVVPREPAEYGLRSKKGPFTILQAAFGEWPPLLKDMWHSGSIRGAVAVALSSPGAPPPVRVREEAVTAV